LPEDYPWDCDHIIAIKKVDTYETLYGTALHP
jgi:hypothetical protein